MMCVRSSRFTDIVFWKTGCACLLAVGLLAWTHGSPSSSNWNGQITQTNLPALETGGDYPFLDATKESSDWKRKSPNIPIDVSLMNAQGFPTSNADLATYSGWGLGLFIPSQTQRAGNYIHDWTGNASFSYSGFTIVSVSGSGCANSSGTVSGNNCAVTGTPTSTFPIIFVTCVANNCGGSTGTTALTAHRFYFASDQAALNGGAIFNAQFLSRLSNFGVARFLDKGNFGGNLTEAVWSDRTPTAWYTYADSYYPSSLVTTNLVTLNTGAKYTLAFGGFTLTDKAHVIANLTGTITPPSLTTTAAAAAGTSTLTFSSVPASIVVGMKVWDNNSTQAIQFTATVASTTATTVVLQCATLAGFSPSCTNPIWGGGVGNGDVIYFSPMLNINSTGYIPIGDMTGTALPGPGGQTSLSANYSIFTYDQDLNMYLVANGADNIGLDGGWPPEIMVALANAAKMHPWFPSPYLALDEPTNWHVSLTDYVSANLNAGLIPRYEPSNETWNYGGGGFDQTHYADNKEFLRNGVNFDHDNWYGRATSRMCQTIQTTYSNNRTLYDCIDAFAAFVDGGPVKGGVLDTRMTAAEYVSNGGQPAYNYVTKVAYAPYWSSAYVNTTDEIGWAYWYANGASGGQQATLVGNFLAGANVNAATTAAETLAYVEAVTNPVFATYASAYTTALSPVVIGTTQYEGHYETSNGGSDVQAQSVPITAITTGTTTVVQVAPSFTASIINSGCTLHVTAVASGALFAGMAVRGASVAAVTQVAFGPAGGTGDYTLQTCASGNVGSESMTGDNAWNYIYNTAGLSGATTTIAGVCAALNGQQTILSAAVTTITVNVNTTGGCSYGGSGGAATYDGAGGNNGYMVAFELAVKQSSQIAPFELSNFQNFYASGAAVSPTILSRFPSVYVFSGTIDWSAQNPDVYQSVTPTLTAVQQFQATPYLLNRDLDPASNDNSPAWLDKAA
jgi:hypothetical protein